LLGEFKDIIEMKETYTLVHALRSGQFRRLLWKQVHIAGTTKVDMKRTYSLVLPIRLSV
jgi:hypothetical protein